MWGNQHPTVTSQQPFVTSQLNRFLKTVWFSTRHLKNGVTFFHWLENTWQSQFCTSCLPKANMLCLHNGTTYTNKVVNKYNMIQLTADINFSFFISHRKSTFHHVRIVNVSELESTNSRPSLGTRTAGIKAGLQCRSCYFLPG